MNQADAKAREIPGYDYSKAEIPSSPLSLDELRKLEQAIGWSEEDAKWLKVAAETLVPKAEEMVDSWRAVIGKQPHLLASFLKPDGKPDDEYKAAVKRRFVQWVSDVCLRPHDQDWLNYQEEIGKRHTPAKKNQTDHAHTPPVVPMRYLVGFMGTVIPSVRGFLVSSGRNETELRHMQDAWTRAIILNITLWTRPYCPADLW